MDQNISRSYATYQLYSHVVASGESNAYVFTPLAPQRQHVWIAADVAGAGGIDAYGNVWVNNSMSYTTPSITPSQGNDIAIAFNLPFITTSATWTNPAGWGLGIGPTSTWSGEALNQTLTSASPVSAASTFSAAASGFSAIVLLTSSGTQPTSSPSALPTATASSSPAGGGTAASIAQWTNSSAYAPSSITVSWPSAPAAGDVLLVSFLNNGQSTGAANTYAAPPGWTLVDQNTSQLYATYQTFAHTVGASDVNAYVFTPLAAQRQHVWIGADLRGAAGIDRSANAYVANGTKYTTPTVTPSQANDLAMTFDLPMAASGSTWTNPAGWTFGSGPTSPWQGETLYEALASTAPLSASSTLSSAANGFSAIVLVAPSGAQSTATAQPTPTATATATPIPTPTATPTSGSGGSPSASQWTNGSVYAPAAITVSWPSAPAAGHTLVVAFWNNGQSSGSANTYTAPAGWTLVNQNSGPYATYEAFSHVVAAGESNGYTFTPLAAAREHVWIGVDAANAAGIDQSGSNYISSGTSFTTPVLAPRQGADLAVGFNLPITGASASWTDSPGWTVGNGPTSTWHGQAAYQALSSGTAVSESATLSSSASGFAALVLLAPSGAPTSTPIATPSASPTPGPTSTPGSSIDWGTFAYDLARTGYNPNEKTIGIGSFGTMHSSWSTFPNVGGLIQGEPVLAMNVNVGGSNMNLLYEGGNGGSFSAINADTGAVVWTKSLGTSTYVCDGSTFNWGVMGSAALDRPRNRIYVPDGMNRVHALDLATGAEAGGWPVTVAPLTHADAIHVAMNYNPSNGYLYTATSTHCDISPWYGRLTAIDASTGAIVNTFYPTQGASGGGIWGWGGASIDPSNNNVFIAVGNGDETLGSQTAYYSEQIVELSADLSTVIAHNYPTSLPPMDDEDFGATPLLFQPIGCPPLLAAMNKSGALVIYNRTNIGAGPIQTIVMSLADGVARFRGLPAYDPVTNYLYIELPVNYGIYQQGVGAFSMTASCTLNPTPVWDSVFGSNGDIRSPITIANGVVYISGYSDKTTYAFDASTGTRLWSAALSNNGIAGPIVANGRIYVGDSGGTIRAWQP